MTLEMIGRRTPMERAPEPDLGFEIIPAERYTSAEFMRLEWERMWTKVWLMAGRESDLTEPGDYLTAEIGPESILVVRGADGGLGAYYNVCQHRGRQLRSPGMGHAESFQCPYHRWEWNIDGTLKAVTDLETFTQFRELPCQQYKLSTVQCDTWGGWVWVNMDPGAESLRDYLGIIPEHLDPYHFEEQYLVQDLTIEWDCNWKAAVDAFNEAYHVQGIHQQLLEMLDDYNIEMDMYDRHSRFMIPFGLVSPRYPNQEDLTEPLKDMMRRAGLDPETFTGKMRDVRPALQRAVREQGRALGIDFSELNDDQMTDDFHYTIFPNVNFNIHARGAAMFKHRPHPTDPNKMYYDIQNYTRIPEGATPPERPEWRQYKHGEISLGLTLDQDADNLPYMQNGMRSRGFQGLTLGRQERRLRHFHKVLMDYIDDGR